MPLLPVHSGSFVQGSFQKTANQQLNYSSSLNFSASWTTIIVKRNKFRQKFQCAVAPHTVTDSVPIKYSAYSAKEIMTLTTNTFESGQRPSP